MLIVTVRIPRSWQGEKILLLGLGWHPGTSKPLCNGQLAAVDFPMIMQKTCYYWELIYSANGATSQNFLQSSKGQKIRA